MKQEILRWLKTFARAVRERNYDTGGLLFGDDVYSFGTVMPKGDGLTMLRERQWQLIWEKTAGFDFDYAQLKVEIMGDHAWVAAIWSSHTAIASTQPQARHGRATIILKCQEGQWMARHTHFSIMPEGTPDGF